MTQPELSYWSQSAPCISCKAAWRIKQKNAALQLETNHPSFLVVTDPSTTDKYADPNIWDLVSATQKENFREMPVSSTLAKHGKKKTHDWLGGPQYDFTVENVAPGVYKLAVSADLPQGEYFFWTGVSSKGVIAGYDFSIVRK